MSDDRSVAAKQEATVSTAVSPRWRRVLGSGGRQASPLRRWSVVAMMIVASIGILVATVALWTHSLLFNTDQYVKTVGPLGKDPAVTQAVADTVTLKALEASDFENRVREALPPRAQFLAQPLTVQIQDYLDQKVNEFLQTETAYNAWVGMNRNLHQQLVAVLRNQSNVFLVQGDDMRLNLLPLVARALQLVQEYLPDAITTRVAIPQIDPGSPYDQQVAALSNSLGRTLPADFGTVTIFKGAQIQKAQQVVRTFDRLVILLWIVTALLIAAALVLSPWRLRTLLELGLGTLVAVMIARVAIRQVENALIAGIKGQSEADVARAIVTSAVASLGSFTNWLLLAGLILTVAAFIGGRPYLVKAAGAGAVKLADKVAAMAGSQLPDAQRLAGTYFDHLRSGGVVVALVVLFFAASSLTGTIVTLAMLVAWELLVWWLARRRPTTGGVSPE